MGGVLEMERSAFVKKIAALEGGETGQTFSSGMAAITAIGLSRLEQGNHLLSTNVVYGGTYGLFSSILTKFGIEVSFVDTSNHENVKRNIRKNTKLIFLETPANPTMIVSDIEEIG